LPHFAKRYHVFAVDVRGHGKSTWTTGEYSYVRCGEDLRAFLREVVRKPAIVSGLSSGAVIALWLAANAPESVAAAISEDPPFFSSLWPRIAGEPFMRHLFETMVEFLGRPERDVRGYFLAQGIPKQGRKDLLLIPHWIGNFIVSDFELNRRLRPGHKYDVPMAPFNGRVGFKFLCEYDVDFSKATIDGRLSEGFDPEGTLRCPVLLIHASWSRHETWGLLGAMDDADAERMRALVRTLKYEKVKSVHDVHLSKPKVFIKVVDSFLDRLAAS
jgi:pimeloyl-ACP methyl ester carboxylesterase